ncbi:hypothetical protein GCM10022377_17930 [Zhihengliuella alba]|uniref:Uncharacterized protein n=1 Tax=Zhihengliuella alba TaxID=547018 RepID=A0ABP7DEV7_9MICC
MHVRRRRLLLLLPLLFAALLGMHTLAMSLPGAPTAPDRGSPHSSAAHSSDPGSAHHRMVLPFAAESAPAAAPSAQLALPAQSDAEVGAFVGQHSADDDGAAVAVAVAGWCLLALAVLLRLVRPRAHLLPGLALAPRTTVPAWVPTPRPARPPSLLFLSISRT